MKTPWTGRVLPVFFTCAQCLNVGIAGDSDWNHYGGSERGLQYSPLDQIAVSNVSQLREAWRYRTGETGQGMDRPFAFEANPVLAEGKLYVVTGSAIVIALDPATGREIWRFDAKIDRNISYAERANRGVTSWTDSTAAPGEHCRHRILAGTLDARLIALDGENGAPCPGFGENGTVHLDRGVRVQKGDSIEYTITSPPVIVNDTLITGSAIGDNGSIELPYGTVRGLDVRTGEERWRWDPLPRDANNPASPGWNHGEVQKTGAANAWPPFAADSELGLVYIPTGSASPDFYGGEREGDNLYANSLVALRAGNGELVWYRQLVHHDLWDYDLASQPTLADLRRGDTVIPAVIQGTKTGLVFTFNRETGEPVFAVEERPVPQGGVDGEHLSATQPFPVAPPPLGRTGPLTEDDAWGLLFLDRLHCARRIKAMRSEGIYTPPGIEGTLLLPGYAGGINWGGIAFDPGSQVAVTAVMNLAMEVALIPQQRYTEEHNSGDYEGYEFARQKGTPFAMRRKAFLSPLGVPCIKPPWGTLAAINMESGRINWQVPLGTIEDIAPAFVPNIEYGVPHAGGPIITAGGLVFIAAAMDDYIRAFELTSGKNLWQARLPAGGQATPMTYHLDSTGLQYVVIAAGGHPNMGTTMGDYVVAYTLPVDIRRR